MVAQKHLHEIKVCLNNIIQTMAWSKKFSHTTIPDFIKNNKILKLNIYKLELAKFMHQLFNHKLSQPYESLFTQIERIHSHGTRPQTTIHR